MINEEKKDTLSQKLAVVSYRAHISATPYNGSRRYTTSGIDGEPAKASALLYYYIRRMRAFPYESQDFAHAVNRSLMIAEAVFPRRQWKYYLRHILNVSPALPWMDFDLSLPEWWVKRSLPERCMNHNYWVAINNTQTLLVSSLRNNRTINVELYSHTYGRNL